MPVFMLGQGQTGGLTPEAVSLSGIRISPYKLEKPEPAKEVLLHVLQ